MSPIFRLLNSRPGRRCEFAGLPVNVEIEVGEVKSGVDENGMAWHHEYQFPYGEILKTEGADRDPVDVYLGPDESSDKVFVVHQVRADGEFDEDKVLLGFCAAGDAERAYRDHGPDWGFGSMDEMTLDQFVEGYLASNRPNPPSGSCDTIEGHLNTASEQDIKDVWSALSYDEREFTLKRAGLPPEYRQGWALIPEDARAKLRPLLVNAELSNPSPRSGEAEGDYVSRFMASAEAQRDYPDQKQRLAVAYSMYRERNSSMNNAAAIVVTQDGNSYDLEIMDGTHVKMRFTGGDGRWGIPLHIGQLAPEVMDQLKAKGLADKGNGFLKENAMKDLDLCNACGGAMRETGRVGDLVSSRCEGCGNAAHAAGNAFSGCRCGHTRRDHVDLVGKCGECTCAKFSDAGLPSEKANSALDSIAPKGDAFRPMFTHGRGVSFSNSRFTPLSITGERLDLELAPGEDAKIERGRPWSAKLKLTSGQYVYAKGADCGAPGCFCDAELTRPLAGNSNSALDSIAPKGDAFRPMFTHEGKRKESEIFGLKPGETEAKPAANALEVCGACGGSMTELGRVGEMRHSRCDACGRDEHVELTGEENASPKSWYFSQGNNWGYVDAETSSDAMVEAEKVLKSNKVFTKEEIHVERKEQRNMAGTCASCLHGLAEHDEFGCLAGDCDCGVAGQSHDSAKMERHLQPGDLANACKFKQGDRVICVGGGDNDGKKGLIEKAIPLSPSDCRYDVLWDDKSTTKNLEEKWLKLEVGNALEPAPAKDPLGASEKDNAETIKEAEKAHAKVEKAADKENKNTDGGKTKADAQAWLDAHKSEWMDHASGMLYMRMLNEGFTDEVITPLIKQLIAIGVVTNASPAYVLEWRWNGNWRRDDVEKPLDLATAKREAADLFAKRNEKLTSVRVIEQASGKVVEELGNVSMEPERDVDCAEWFEAAFGRKPASDPQYFKEWQERWKKGPRDFMSSQYAAIFDRMKGVKNSQDSCSSCNKMVDTKDLKTVTVQGQLASLCSECRKTMANSRDEKCQKNMDPEGGPHAWTMGDVKPDGTAAWTCTFCGKSEVHKNSKENSTDCPECKDVLHNPSLVTRAYGDEPHKMRTAVRDGVKHAEVEVDGEWVPYCGNSLKNDAYSKAKEDAAEKAWRAHYDSCDSCRGAVEAGAQGPGALCSKGGKLFMAWETSSEAYNSVKNARQRKDEYGRCFACHHDLFEHQGNGKTYKCWECDKLGKECHEQDENSMKNADQGSGKKCEECGHPAANHRGAEDDLRCQICDCKQLKNADQSALGFQQDAKTTTAGAVHKEEDNASPVPVAVTYQSVKNPPFEVEMSDGSKKMMTRDQCTAAGVPSDACREAITGGERVGIMTNSSPDGAVHKEEKNEGKGLSGQKYVDWCDCRWPTGSKPRHVDGCRVRGAGDDTPINPSIPLPKENSTEGTDEGPEAHMTPTELAKHERSETPGVEAAEHQNDKRDDAFRKADALKKEVNKMYEKQGREPRLLEDDIFQEELRKLEKAKDSAMYEWMALSQNSINTGPSEEDGARKYGSAENEDGE